MYRAVNRSRKCLMKASWVRGFSRVQTQTTPSFFRQMADLLELSRAQACKRSRAESGNVCGRTALKALDVAWICGIALSELHRFALLATSLQSRSHVAGSRIKIFTQPQHKPAWCRHGAGDRYSFQLWIAHLTFTVAVLAQSLCECFWRYLLQPTPPCFVLDFHFPVRPKRAQEFL